MHNPKIADYSTLMNASIHDVITCIDRSGRKGVALILDQQSRLLNIITDGDVRRGILAGFNLNDPATKLLHIKERMPHPVAVTAAADSTPAELLSMMQKKAIKQLPLIDSNGKVVDVVVLSDLLPQSKRAPLQAVVMAGGLGSRLRPLTDTIPKPMLLVGGRPLMEITINKLYSAGIRQVDVSTNYLASSIVDHFGDGKAFGVEMSYLNEERPLGTAGALGLMEKPDKTLLVINGDIITEVDLENMLDYHNEHKAAITIGVRQYSVQVPYGVVECNGSDVCKLTEKPHLSFLVNAGIYLLEPSVFAFIEKNKRMDMTDLIQRLLDKGGSIVSFPIIEYWLDIGQPADYAQAQQDAEMGKHQRQ